MEKIHFSKKEVRFKHFQNQFNHIDELTEKHFHRKSNEFMQFVKKMRWWGEVRKNYTCIFSEYNWDNLKQDQKIRHTLSFCTFCDENYKKTQEKFPIAIGHKKKGKKESTNNTCSTPKTHIEIPITEKKEPCYAAEAARSVLRELNQSFEGIYHQSFTSILPKLRSPKLTPRKSKIQKQHTLRKIHKNVKKSIEAAWCRENRDVETHYGTRQSGSRHSKQRSSLFFETKSKAVKRTSGVKIFN